MAATTRDWLSSYRITPSALATPNVIARTCGALYVLGALPGAAIAAVMPPGRGKIVVFATVLVSFLIGAWLLAKADRIAPLSVELAGLMGTVILVVAILSATSDIAALSLSSYFVFVSCNAAFFLPPRRAALHTAVAAVTCFVAIGLRPGLPWWCGLVTVAVVVVVGAAVGVLVRIASDADIDSLTGLLNRRGFDNLADAELAHAARTGRRPAIVLSDLDRFKTINDTQGHRAGDALLQEVAHKWQAHLRRGEVVARYGGDEFAVLLPYSTEIEAVRITEELRQEITTGCSAGVTSWEPGESTSRMVSRADDALYRAKQAGRGLTMLESSTPSPLIAELQEAIDSQTVDVHFQPIVTLVDGRTVGYEALVRWESRTEPGISAAQTVRIAEENDFVAALDELVLRRACVEATDLCKGDIRIALHVNVSGLNLARAGFVSDIDSVLDDTGWHASRLVLEVTESVLDLDAPIAIENLRTLRARGVRVAIDDFGTGSSSLSRLGSLPNDLLKLDRVFVASIARDTGATPLLGAIAAMSSALGLELIAEGVEDTHQASILAGLGYPLAQGYLYGKPQPAGSIIECRSAQT